MGSVINAQGMFNRMRMWLAGVSFNGARDYYETFGYHRNPDFRIFIAKYNAMGTAQRIVNAPVSATWGDPPQLAANNQEFASAWQEIVQTNKLWHHIIRLDKLAGLGRYAVMVVGFDDGGKLSTPVRQGRAQKILYLQPYHEGAVQITKWETDGTNPRFNKPLMYSVNPKRIQLIDNPMSSTWGINTPEPIQPFDVHYSRIIHVAENLLEDGIYGESRLKCVNNDLDDLLKITGGSAELFWLNSNRGMQVDVDKEVDIDAEAAKELQQEIEDYQHELRRFIRTRGVKVNKLGSDVVNPENAYRTCISQISIATGIPQLILMGVTSGHMASQQDRANWAERIAERVTEYAQPVVLQPTMDCFINAGVLPEPQNLVINWPEAFKMNPLERAQTSAQMARSAANLAKSHTMMQPTETTQNPDGTTTETPAAVEPLFTPDEMRRMVSFGKHPPVFDAPQAQGGLTPVAGDEAAAAASAGGGGFGGGFHP